MVQVNGTTTTMVDNQFQVNANSSLNTVIGQVDAVPDITQASLYRVDEEGNRTLETSCMLGSDTFTCVLPSLSVDESGTQFEVLVINDLGNVTRTIILLVQGKKLRYCSLTVLSLLHFSSSTALDGMGWD